MFATIFKYLREVFFGSVIEKEPDTWVGVLEFNFYDDPKTKVTVKTTYLHLFETADGDRYTDYSIKSDSWQYSVYPYKQSEAYNKVVKPWLNGLGISQNRLSSSNPYYFKKDKTEVKQEGNVFHIEPKKPK